MKTTLTYEAACDFAVGLPEGIVPLPDVKKGQRFQTVEAHITTKYKEGENGGAWPIHYTFVQDHPTWFKLVGGCSMQDEPSIGDHKDPKKKAKKQEPCPDCGEIHENDNLDSFAEKLKDLCISHNVVLCAVFGDKQNSAHYCFADQNILTPDLVTEYLPSLMSIDDYAEEFGQTIMKVAAKNMLEELEQANPSDIITKLKKALRI
jgi:hypothetical protein